MLKCISDGQHNLIIMALQPNGKMDEYEVWRQAIVWISLFAKCGRTNLKIRAKANNFLPCWIHLQMPLNSTWEYTLTISLMNSIDSMSCICSFGSLMNLPCNSVLHVKMHLLFLAEAFCFFFTTWKLFWITAPVLNAALLTSLW